MNLGEQFGEFFNKYKKSDEIYTMEKIGYQFEKDEKGEYVINKSGHPVAIVDEKGKPILSSKDKNYDPFTEKTLKQLKGGVEKPEYNLESYSNEGADLSSFKSDGYKKTGNKNIDIFIGYENQKAGYEIKDEDDRLTEEMIEETTEFLKLLKEGLEVQDNEYEAAKKILPEITRQEVEYLAKAIEEFTEKFTNEKYTKKQMIQAFKELYNKNPKIIEKIAENFANKLDIKKEVIDIKDVFEKYRWQNILNKDGKKFLISYWPNKDAYSIKYMIFGETFESLKKKETSDPRLEFKLYYKGKIFEGEKGDQQKIVVELIPIIKEQPKKPEIKAQLNRDKK